ncbi:MAG TPA: ATP-binding protein, partial [Candidatus Limnocylindria bacterium]|nr:ATP-binding protein [Candidatus Limnocylindria bacterium]
MAITQLLYRGESESLDFKRDQYPFIGADDATKGELLKDILAMANSWRNESAYILIGIDESTTPPQVVGISEHLDDAMLQQFVNGKTQRPLKFSYYAAEIQGRSVGVIEIPVQSRPIFLRKNFGKLRLDTVYLRRGSSTGEASPDEIAEIGAARSSLSEGDLGICFAKSGIRELGSNRLEIESNVYRVKEEDSIPDFDPPQIQNGWPRMSVGFDDYPNKHFYRELVYKTKQDNLLRPAAITVTNGGALAAKEIRVEFVLRDEKRIWEFCEEDDLVTERP